MGVGGIPNRQSGELRVETVTGHKIVLAIIVFFLFTIMTALFGLYQVEQRLRSQVVKNLQLVLETAKDNIRHVWLDNMILNASDWASDPILIKAAQDLLSSRLEQSALLKNPAQQQLREFFNEKLKAHFSAYVKQRDALGFFVISPEHINLASMRDGNVGEINLIVDQRPQFFDKALAGKPQFVPPVHSDVPLPNRQGVLTENFPTMFVLVPIRDQKGQVISVLAIRLDPFEVFTRMAQLGRMGESGEAYIFDADGRMLTESRFDDQLERIGLVEEGESSLFNVVLRDPGKNLLRSKGIDPESLSSQPFTFMVRQAISGKSSSSTSSYRDYRGVPVLGAWAWDKQLEVGFASEIDEAEALQSYGYTRRVVLAMFILIMVGGGVFIYIIARMQKSAREDLTVSENYLRNVLDNAADSIVTITEKGKILAFNRAAEKMFGYSSEEALDQDVSIIMPAPENRRHASYINNYLRTGEAKIIGTGREVMGRRKDGGVIPLRLGLSEIIMGNQRLFTGIMHDLSQQKNAEAEIRQRTLELEEAKDKAEAANRAKTDFLAMMSHEIRTPMNVIIGLSHLAQKTDLDTRQKNYIERISASAESMLSIINDILDFTKIEAGSLLLENIDFTLDEVLEKFSSFIEVKAREKGLKFSIDIHPDAPVNLIGDPMRLHQVLVNLGDNAVKFTKQGEVALRVASQGHGDEQVILKFSMRDTGIGIDPEKQQFLFQSFYQADSSRQRQYGGTGLGLAIVKRLVTMMGGEIGFESQPGLGSTFFFTVVVGKGKGNKEQGSIVEALSKPAMDEGASRSVDDLRGLRVLVVDDNESNLEIACEILNQHGVVVSVARNGQQALDTLNVNEFDLVLMDVQMPVMDGLTATRMIRQQASLNSLPVVAISAAVLEEDRQEALDAGMNDFVTKPIDINEFRDALLRWMPGNRRGRASHNNELGGVNDQGLVLAGINGVDTEAGIRVCNGNPVLYKKMLRDFKKEAAFAAMFNTAISADDIDTARRLVHSLIGLAGNIGADGVSHEAKRLQDAVKEGGSKEEMEARVHSVDQALMSVILAIESFEAGKARNSGPKSLGMPVDDLSLLLKQTAETLAEYDTAALQMIAKIRAGLEGNGYDAELAELIKCGESYDFDGALESLRKLASALDVVV